MAVIQSGASATQWTIDTASNAGRITFYDTNGNPMSSVSSLNNTLNALNAAVSITLGGQSTAGVNVSGTSGSLTLSFEATMDNSHWFSISATPIPSGSTVTSTTADGQWVVDLAGFYAVRTRISAFTSGSMTVSVVVTPNNSKNISQTVSLSSGVAQGAPNTIGNSWPVEITDGTNVLGVTAHPVKIDPTGTTTQPISGTVTANIGTSGSLALDATLTGGTARTKITDGTNNAALASAAPAGTEQALIVRNIPSGTQTISGTVSANQSGTWTVQPGNTANITPWLSTISQGGNSATVTASNALKVDGSAVTQPVSGTITANIGTSGSLALDTTVSGLQVSQGSTTSGQKGELTLGAVTTAAPSYTTAQSSPLSLTTAGALRVDASATTQPISGTVTANAGTGSFTVVQTTAANLNATVTGTVTSNQGTANTLSNRWPVQITDGTNTMPTGDAVGRAIFNKVTDGTNTAAVKAASTAPVAADPALVIGVSTNSYAAQDRSSITPGIKHISIIGGFDNGIARVARVGEFGTQRTTSEVVLWHDAVEGSTVNAFWTQSTTTMTIAQSTGALSLNNASITTANTDAIITSQRQFPKYPRNPLYVRFRASISANAASNHTLVELGLGAPSGVTATISNGVFFRWTAAGNLNAVISFNGTEQSTQILAQGSITANQYYYYDIVVDDDYARFIVNDSSGVPVVDTQLSITNTVAYITAVSHNPSFARVYTDATGGGTAIKLNISAHSVQMLDGIFNLNFAEQSAMAMRNAQYSPTTYTSTTSFTTDASTTPSVSSGINAFGGEFIASTYPASTSALLEHFAYQIPSPYSLVLTGVNISPDAVTTAFVGGAISLVYYIWINASTNNTSTATGGTKIPLGTRFFTVTQTVGNIGSQLMWAPKTPLVCLPGTFVIMGVKATGTAVTAGVVRHVWTPEGYFI